MFYGVKLDIQAKVLEIKEYKNIHAFAKENKLQWVDVKAYLDGDANRLSAGVPFPLIKKRTKEMYLISKYNKLIHDWNYPFMSKDVWNELVFKESYKNGYEGLR